MRTRKLFVLLLTLSLAIIGFQPAIKQLVENGNAAQKAGNYAQAEAIWKQVLEGDPNNVEAYNNLGNALHKQKKLDESIVQYRKAIQLDPNYVDAYYNLGFALKNQKKLDEAIEVRIAGKFKQIHVGIDPQLPVNSLQSNLLTSWGLPNDVVIAIIPFVMGVIASVFTWLINDFLSWLKEKDVKPKS